MKTIDGALDELEQRGPQQTRCIVRGHFRNQPCGPGRVDHKRIYIKPFWRGPADGPQPDRTYTVT